MSNLPVIGVSVKKRVRWKLYSKRMTKDFLKLIKRRQPTDSEFQQTQEEINTQKTTEDWKWRDKTWINNIKNEKGDIITDLISIKESAKIL